MMLSTGNLRVLLVTHHQSILSVPDSLTIEKITEKIELAYECGKKLNIENPRIAVCALNPHAGENCAFGDEEERIISPAIEISHENKINVTGPYPSDTLFYRAAKGEFDFVIAMYHDQGLIPVKLIGFENGVNTTLGLPFVRTSPDHGSAYDIAGKGIANPESMISAIEMAIRLTFD
jgi:4-hydroxythreonine-4-phosphate dehydrogenase